MITPPHTQQWRTPPVIPVIRGPTPPPRGGGESAGRERERERARALSLALSLSRPGPGGIPLDEEGEGLDADEGGIVFEAHRLLYHAAYGSRIFQDL